MHWFCPRSTADDYELYFDEDIQLNGRSQESDDEKAARVKKVLEAEERRDAVLEACKIFAFDGADAKTYADRFRLSLGEQLRRCDICVREYHRARQLLIQRLEAQFDTDDVISFMQDHYNASCTSGSPPGGPSPLTPADWGRQWLQIHSGYRPD